MSIYIQTSDGLREINAKPTKENIIESLGYEPADSETIKNITDDGSDNFSICDSSGNIIARVDSDGIHTTELELNGINIKEFLNTLINNIEDDGSGEFSITDSNGNVITKIDKNGVHSVEFEAKGVNLYETLTGHVENESVHVTQEDKDSWNNKSTFSGSYDDLTNKPSISKDQDDSFVISDGNNNVMAKFDESGLTTTRIMSQQVSTDTLLVNGIDLESTQEELKEAALSHIEDTSVHVTNTDKEKWNNKSDFSGIYTDLVGIPNILDDESSEFSIADSSGNVVFKVDNTGIASINAFVDGYNLQELLPELQDGISSLSTDLENNVATITTQLNSNRSYTETVENNLTSDIATIESTYLPLTGGALTGTLNGKLIKGSSLQAGDTSTNGGVEIYHDTPFIDFHFGKTTKDYTSRIVESAEGVLTVSGSLIVNKQLKRSGTSSSWYNGRDNALICQNTISGYSPVMSVKTTSGSWEIGSYNKESVVDRLLFTFINDASYEENDNSTYTRISFDEYGTMICNFITCSSDVVCKGNITCSGSIEVGMATCEDISVNTGISLGTYCSLTESDLILGGKDTSIWGGKDNFYRLIRREYESSSNHAVKLGNTTDDLRLFGTNITLGNDGASVTSDKRLKEDFGTLEKYESLYMDLKPTSFKYKAGTSNRTHIGFIAQEVKESLEDNNLTTTDFAGYVESALDVSTYKEDFGEEPPEDFTTELSLRYDEFVALNTYMIQKLYKENEALKDLVLKMQQEINKIKETA